MLFDGQHGASSIACQGYDNHSMRQKDLRENSDSSPMNTSTMGTPVYAAFMRPESHQMPADERNELHRSLFQNYVKRKRRCGDCAHFVVECFLFF